MYTSMSVTVVFCCLAPSLGRNGRYFLNSLIKGALDNDVVDLAMLSLVLHLSLGLLL